MVVKNYFQNGIPLLYDDYVGDIDKTYHWILRRGKLINEEPKEEKKEKIKVQAEKNNLTLFINGELRLDFTTELPISLNIDTAKNITVS